MQEGERKKIRLIVLGDEFVGKSTLISAIISQIPTNVQRRMKRVILPPDMCKFSKDVFTEIIDTSTTETNFEEQLNKSDLAILVYDVSSQNTIQRLTEYWLPLIQRQSPQIPVILVGNKSDQLQLAIQQDRNYHSIQDILKKVTPAFRQVQMGLQCSAYYDRHVKQVLNCAQRAVLYPLSPLYDIKTRSLNGKYKKALARIFRILDKDLDGKLSDQQLGALQERVFKTELNSQDIKVIKDIIIKEQQQMNEDFITLDGFIALNKKCIQTVKIQLSWNILRYFKYNNDMSIKIPQERFHLEQEQSLELALSALNFLHSLYVYAIKTSPNSPIDLIFSCSPQRPQLAQFQLPLIDLETFLYAWNYLAFIDYQLCYRYLYYIGYEEDISNAFKKTNGKHNYSDFCKIKQRKIISVGFIESQQSVNYLNDLFINCQQEDGIQRKYRVTKFDGNSKILLLFRIQKSKIMQFYKSNISKKLDLIIYFCDSKQESVNLDEQIRKSIKNQYIMIRRINIKEAQIGQKMQQKEGDDYLKILGVQYLDLQSVPIKYKPQSYIQLDKIINRSLSKIELGLTAELIIELKSRQKKNKMLAIFGGGTALLIAIGVYYFTNSRKN